MSNVWRLFRDDLRLVKGNVAALLVVLGLCLVPAAYAWFNIGISGGIFANSEQLTVAVANSDEGYETSLTATRLSIGDRVVEKLHGNDDYRWVFVDEDDALEGVKSGDYYMAVVIPTDFSKKTMSVLSADSERANVDCHLNSKLNPLASVVAGAGGSEAVEDIRVKFAAAVDEAAAELVSDFVSFASSDNAADVGTRLVARLDKVASGLDDAASQIRAFSNLSRAASSLTSASAQALVGSEGAADAVDASDSVIAKAADELSVALSSARSAASDIQRQVDAAKSESGLGKVGTGKAQQLVDEVGSLVLSVGSISRGASSAADSLKEAVKSLADSSGSLSSGLNGMRDELGIAANKLNAAASKIRKFQEDVASAIAEGDADAVASIVSGNRASLSRWLANPVRINTQVMFPVENFGSSLAPYYTVLAAWLCAVLLVFMMKPGISRDRIRGYEAECGCVLSHAELYFGRFLLFGAIALVQATVMVLGELLFLRIQCVNPALLLVASWLCAVVFSNIAYTLVVSFGGIGRALCAFMLVMQVVGFGGVLPGQMIGGAFQVACALFPFIHGVHAMQASIAGDYGVECVLDLLRVCAFLVPSLILGVAARKPLIRATNALSTKLEEAGF